MEALSSRLEAGVPCSRLCFLLGGWGGEECLMEDGKALRGQEQTSSLWGVRKCARRHSKRCTAGSGERLKPEITIHSCSSFSFPAVHTDC